MGVADFLALVRTMDRLLTLEKKHGDALELLQEQLRNISDRLTKLESREEMLIIRAEAAAASAASAAASNHLSELARHIGALDERTRKLDGQNLSMITAEQMPSGEILTRLGPSLPNT